MSLGKKIEKILNILESIEGDTDMKRKYYTYMKIFKNYSILGKIEKAYYDLDILLGEIQNWTNEIDCGLTAEQAVFSWDEWIEGLNG